MEQSDQLQELAAALVRVQAVVEGAKKDSANPFFKSKYADLESVWGVCRPPLTANGLAVVQTTEPNDHGVTVVTTLLHTSGQWMRGKLSMRPVKDDPQGIGSCITYARRYALAALVGVVQVDDDGERASGRGGTNGATLEPPKRLSERPPAAPALTLDGELSLEEKYGRVINPGEIRSLMGLLDVHHISTDALKRFVLERWQVHSRKEIRVGMLSIIAAWVAAEGKAA